MVEAMQRLKVSDNQRGLTLADGTPFFWLGDTAWEMFHKLNREEMEFYMRTREEQGFNVIQAAALAEFEGVTTGNAYGKLPLHMNEHHKPDPSKPAIEGENSYWDHVDFAVRTAASHGIYIAFLPTWGDKINQLWGKGPEIFTPDNAYAYGYWLGDRYKDDPNIVWVLGGDRPMQKRVHFEIVNEMARGLKEGDQGSHLMTFHPNGGASSSLPMHEEAWLDFNMIQSSHSEGERQNYKLIQEDYVKHPVKPTLDSEPCYEDIPKGFNSDNGYFDESDVRKAAYYAVFAGGFGHTYGHHSVWSMYNGVQQPSFALANPNPDLSFIMDWQTALTRPGAKQMQYLKNLIESREASSRIPDQELIAVNYSGSNYMTATRGSNYAWIYCPNGVAVQAVMGRTPGEQVQAAWYCPRTGQSTPIGSCSNTGIQTFQPPSSGRGNDWVLCLDT